MKVTYCGHACMLVETKGKKLLFDPFLTYNELFDAARLPHLSADQIQADYILLSHGHEDHVADAEQIARRTGATLISNAEIISWYAKKGLAGHMMNHGGTWKFDFGTVRYVHAVHSSSLPDGSNGGNPGGFVIWNDEGCFYFAGDTALSMDMKLIPMTCPKLDFAILPIGDNFTMGPADAVLASSFIECDTVIGCHYDTFGYIKIDHAAAQKAFSDNGKELILLPIGGSKAF
ncbi:MAG: metal-dependent hydrolase [Haliscomenobacter sp.]|nr:metal-dependent hydrolase [Haliscomenobacter sp.]MBK8879129.1 metal-dependent hydrolase [Haliscomenobacter sp.]